MPSNKNCIFVLCTICCLTAATTLFAQSYPASSVTFSGDSAFSSTELLAASGVTPGASLDQAGMQAAAQRLNDSGMFATVRFSFNGRELHYELTPATDLLSTQFANFPWWSETNLSGELAKVPLFHGKAAAESGMQRKVIAALTAMLAARQVEAQITAMPGVDAVTGIANMLIFRVTSPQVHIGELQFTGASAEWADRLAEIDKAAAKVDYSTTETPATLTQAIQTMYRDKGYLEANVPSVAAQAPVVDSGVVRVPMMISIEQGAQYRLGQFSLAGSVLMDQTQFLSKATLKPGDVVEESKLRQTMSMLSSPYVTRGYSWFMARFRIWRAANHNTMAAPPWCSTCISPIRTLRLMLPSRLAPAFYFRPKMSRGAIGWAASWIQRDMSGTSLVVGRRTNRSPSRVTF